MSGEWNVVRADIVGLGCCEEYVVRDSDRNVIGGPMAKAMAFEIAAKHNEFVFAVRCAGLLGDFYIVELYGDLSSLFMDIGERLVTGNANPSDDIDFSEWNHELKKENVVNSWLWLDFISSIWCV